jgi:hypothetical protein
MGDHFDKKEKNLPGGATVAKYSKQNLKLLYPYYLTAPHECTEVGRAFLIHFPKRFFSKIAYKDKNSQRTQILCLNDYIW